MDVVRLIRFLVAIYQEGFMFCLAWPLVALLLLSVRNLLLVPLDRALTWFRNR